jgi:lysylphosphatidylglycerol synthetase-like protein (DUF2156 family)
MEKITPRELGEKLLPVYLTLLGIQVGVLGVMAAEAERLKNTSFVTVPEMFFAVAAGLIIYTASAGIISFLSIVGILRSVLVHIVVFITMVVGVASIVIGWSARVFT